MKSVGIREFRDKASQYLASREILAVKRHGKVVGFYVPIKQSNEIEVEQALKQLSQTVESVMAESGIDEVSLSSALDLSQNENLVSSTPEPIEPI